MSARALQRWRRGTVLCVACLLASGCEYASDAIVLTRVLPAEPVRDASAGEAAATLDASPDVVVATDAGADVRDAELAEADAPDDTFAVSASRLRALDRGFEVRNWLTSTAYNRNLLSAMELQTLKTSGIRNLRIAFAITVLFDDNAPGVLKPAGLANYDEILDQVLDAGLAAVIHPMSQGTRDWSNPAYVVKMQTFWRAFAAHLVERQRDPDRVFLKIEFDPNAENADAWYAAQTVLVQTVREIDPDRTLLLTPNALTRSMDRNTITAVTEIPVALPNAVFDFGFFLPAAFTHQGANWRVNEPWTEMLHDLPYPSSPALCAPVLPMIQLGVPRQEAQNYCEGQYNRNSIAGLIEPAVSWAKSKRAQLINGGIGVVKRNAPSAGRLQWLEDVRSVLEANGIPWTYWDDSDDFTMLMGSPGRRTVDPGVLHALGLTP